jgi:hypothetical protein
VTLEIMPKNMGHDRPGFTAEAYRDPFEDEATLELSDLTAETGNVEKFRPPNKSSEAVNGTVAADQNAKS